MNPERWKRIERVYHAALERDAVERTEYLKQACAGDDALRQEVESLLSNGKTTDGWLEGQALKEMAGELFGKENGRSLIATQLGPYQVLSLIGAGGMGEVYEARDSKLGRNVAIKVLPAAFVDDPDRLARFQREARVLAALNHPNIATIYGLEQSDGAHYLVMELIPGETMAERINKGALPVEEALKIGGQIAEALEAAHEKGVIHRDLKPANVKVTPEGRVKVLDFGLAKAFTGDDGLDPSNGPTISATGTKEGQILGTAAYMSPEQARGKAVDKRTDIWAFGCVLYELLSARRAFEGEVLTDTIAAVLEREPDWQALPAATPAQVRNLLRRCLQKDKALRLRDAGDARIEIQDALTGQDEGLPAATAWKGRRQTLFYSIASSLAVAIVAAITVWNLKPAPQRTVTRFAMSLPAGQHLDVQESSLAISPDGTRLVYTAGPAGLPTQIYVRAMDGLETRPIPGTEGAEDPFFSPDGQWIGFFASGKLKKVRLDGEALATLAEVDLGKFGATWGGQGMIAFASLNGLRQIPDAGGNPQPLTHLEKEERVHGWPEFLPGGKSLLFAAQAAGAPFPTTVAAQSLTTGERRNLIQSGVRPRYASSGHLVYAQGGNVMAAPFDPHRLEITGASVPLVEGVLPGQYDFSSTGSLVYVPGSLQTAQLKLVWVDRKGTEQPIAAPAHNYVLPKISPDGKRVAVNIEEADNQVWLYDLGRDTLTRLTFEGSTNIDPLWTRDGKRIVFKGAQNRLFWQPADGSAGAEALTSSELSRNNVPGSWSPDGQVVAFMEVNPNTGNDIYTLSLKDKKPQPFLRNPSDESSPCFSPDGHFIAYSSNESGRVEIYVRPYPGPGAKVQISTEGGSEPAWNPKGGELLYRSGKKMMAVDITTQPTFSAGKPRMLFEGPYVPTPRSFPDYDVSPDGQRFLMLKASEQAQAPVQINVVLNWFEELKRRVPK